MILRALLACDGAAPEPDHPEPVDRPSETASDTSEPVTSIATPAAEWAGGPPSGWTGYELAAGRVAGDEVVLVGSPILPGPAYLIDPQVAALIPSASNLAWLGSFADPDGGDGAPPSGFGTSIAIAADGAQIAVGAPNGAVTAEQAGTVFLLDRLPEGREAPQPMLLLHGTLNRIAQFGVAVTYLTLGPDIALVASASGGDSLDEAGIYRFDPMLLGEHGLEVASASISGTPRLGQYLAAWDSDGDGMEEVVAAFAAGVAHFPAPWEGALTEADADATWTDPDPLNQLGEPLQTLGDIDGDGAPDLAIGAQTHSGAETRSGAMFIVSAGPLSSSTATDIATQFLGTELGEGVGSSATTGDYNADGVTDLVVGAYGVPPGQQSGKVLGYLGPIRPGTHVPSDADFVVRGEALFDWFGCDVVTVDADGDAKDDLVVGAQGWGGGHGKVYLYLGADLYP